MCRTARGIRPRCSAISRARGTSCSCCCRARCVCAGGQRLGQSCRMFPLQLGVEARSGYQRQPAVAIVACPVLSNGTAVVRRDGVTVRPSAKCQQAPCARSLRCSTWSSSSPRRRRSCPPVGRRSGRSWAAAGTRAPATAPPTAASTSSTACTRSLTNTGHGCCSGPVSEGDPHDFMCGRKYEGGKLLLNERT